MAKICPFLESKTDIFSCYLPVSDINLAGEKKALGTASSSHSSAYFPSVSLDGALSETISFFFFCSYRFRTTFRTHFDVNAR